jgi:quercetin dioxygenase-like cupin family protein
LSLLQRFWSASLLSEKLTLENALKMSITRTTTKIAFAVPVFLASIMTMQRAMAVDAAPAAKDTQVLQRVGLQGTNRQMGMGISVFPPNAEKPRHMASGPEVCYVIEGEIILQVNGQPTQFIHAGGSFQIPAQAVHVTKAGPSGAKVVATWISEPGKPFNIPISN